MDDQSIFTYNQFTGQGRDFSDRMTQNDFCNWQGNVTNDVTSGSSNAAGFHQGIDQPDTVMIQRPSTNLFPSPGYPTKGRGCHPHRSIYEWKLAEARDRWQTFVNWPQYNPVPSTDLAAAGFIYTGPADTVKCVFCDGRLRNFEVGDTAIGEHQRHFPRCEFVLDFQRDPSVFHFVQENLREKQRSFFQPEIHAAAQYSANKSCSYNETNTFQVPTDVTGSPQSKMGSRMIPARPELSSFPARLATFARWPPGIKQTPNVLAEAGLYYLGVNDSVKCFFCDGGLCNWQPTDDPWEEHKTWFPQCCHVLEHFQENGQRVGGKGHGLTTAAQLKSLGKPPAAPTSSASNGGLVCMTFSSNISPRKRKIDMNKPYIKAAVGVVDCSEHHARKVIKKYIKETGKEFENAEQFLDYLLEMEGTAIDSDSSDSEAETSLCETIPSPQYGEEQPVAAILKEIPASQKSQIYSNHQASQFVNGQDKDMAEALRLENQRLRDERICKICMDADVAVVILPCGHFVCCESCAPALMKCPICRVDIRGTVKTYMS
ncbi:baculoviral IAP repeat-containing protein 7-A-like [Lingula anatina]|uniref:Baculoviral IAP repeat-containing protein 7-A-like n=1 Tax=Lingula anatina TaxID=7574 RepID=A0A1S3IE88_LINAN|nr:baculoviral IAP repeat-containing protein 7-A-like [Lingula anatina]|eukprot:XP_013396547.1 baculoviral IAP repeat-containing protein 7-A-like [Lingula anatina]